MSSTATVPPPAAEERWTEEHLPDVPLGHRVELLDGRPLVSPPPVLGHQVVLTELVLQLSRALPAGLVMLWDQGVRTGPGSFRIPDLVVLRHDLAALAAAGIHDPGAVALAIEVLSPSSLTDDRVRKPAEYASVGIPHYWSVELDPTPQITVHVLRDGAYVRGAPSPRASVPFPVDLTAG